MRLTLMLSTALGALAYHAGLPPATGGPGAVAPSPPPPLPWFITFHISDACDCYNFRNDLTTDFVGQGACARDEEHGIFGTQQFCMPKTGPHIPFVSEGCPSDMYHCVVTYTPKVFPQCQCTEYHNGAYAHQAEDMCVKARGVEPGQRICYRRNEEFDGYIPKEPDSAGVHSKVGGSKHWGCPEDMLPCIDTVTTG